MHPPVSLHMPALTPKNKAPFTVPHSYAFRQLQVPESNPSGIRAKRASIPRPMRPSPMQPTAPPSIPRPMQPTAPPSIPRPMRPSPMHPTDCNSAIHPCDTPWLSCFANSSRPRTGAAQTGTIKIKTAIKLNRLALLHAASLALLHAASLVAFTREHCCHRGSSRGPMAMEQNGGFSQAARRKRGVVGVQCRIDR